MMRSVAIDAVLLAALPLIAGQNVSTQDSLANALAGYPKLSTFRGLLTGNPAFLGTILPSTSAPKVTVLVPDNDAFAKFSAKYGDLSSISTDLLISTLKYHFMVSELRGQDLAVAGGITVPTLLQDEAYNNRTAGAELTGRFGSQATGQVIFASTDPVNPSKIKVRQSNTNIALRGGLDQGGDLTPLDGAWQGGLFQSVDTILNPPTKCTTTVRSVGNPLSALDFALNRTNLWPALDTTRNVTCLAPNTEAFLAAGNPQQSLSVGNLTNALLFHTLEIPTYPNFLRDGQVIRSLANLTVRISRRGGDLYFNDAKVVTPNVLTNNGVIHILDRVMSPLNDTGSTSPSSTSAASSPSPTAPPTGSSAPSSSPTTSSRNAGPTLDASRATPGFVAFAIAALLLG